MRGRVRRDNTAIPAGKEAGVTFAEIVVVSAIVGIVALVAVPNVALFSRAYRIRTMSDQLTSHLKAARQISVSQRLPVSFTINPSPDNEYSFSYTIPGQPTTTETFTLAKEVIVSTTPSGPLTFDIKQNGTVTNPTTPDDQNPTTNFVRLTSWVGGSTTDEYTITLLAAGKVGVRFER